jgi:hypothetical protein
VRLPTGRSPFKIIAGSGEATGSGVGAATVGLNVNKIVDPVALFGSVNFTASLPAKNLWQVNGSRILTRVRRDRAWASASASRTRCRMASRPPSPSRKRSRPVPSCALPTA